ncbi:bifunctional prephenate dehydrogenase/3-phosphoshikimate 1-carboxyvinyltransferase [Endozoicomonas numazuensis]|uniref:bifunctional prephenate dehydrogenase/3-phosphoshikimate 1-carboxyvinyltransferase n=1 Tax=Endozoicomonas numazuensis TaxID=1137799 RepID=UPI0009DFAB45|nr:bifunctional prephenate dehydrogenase/3-phosphoshikimate 1-carboxyvinyltransferase [Endozoicomonas numazuensis]
MTYGKKVELVVIELSKTDAPLNILVVGLGLIGGSFAASLRDCGENFHLMGFDLRDEYIEEAVSLGIVSEGCDDFESAVSKADVIQISVPMLAMPKVLGQLKGLDLNGKVITDVGSCKGSLVKAAQDIFGQVPENLVPGHPIAGSEKSGVTAAKSGLFKSHKVILTPLENTDPSALSLIRYLWQCCGAQVNAMDVQRHDEVLAMTSHLPHLLAFSLVDTLAGNPENQDIFRYAAGGFRDFTRIAGSDPVMWHDIALGNSDAILASLDQFSEGLVHLRQAIVEKDSKSLLATFERARTARQHFASMLERRAYMATLNENQGDSVTFVAQPGGTLKGELRVPGDKSISHRSIMLGALAEGETIIDGFLEGEDSLATLQAFRDMGVDIEGPHDGRVVIHGVGMQGLKPPVGPLYLGNAGTAMRLMAGLMSAQRFDVTLTGDQSLSSRPMDRVVNPLVEMGAEIETAAGGRPPLKIKGGKSLKGIDYEMPMASAQVQSCLLLAGMYAEGETSATAPGVVRDHTNRMLTGFGYPLKVDNARVSIQGGGQLSSTAIDVPGDISSAAFFIVAATIASGSDLLLTHVGINPTRTGVISILQLMGADITLLNEREVGGELVADIRVRSAILKGIDIPLKLVPLAIDEFPVLFIAAACAEGTTTLRGAAELRVKESDRIQSMVDGLVALGIDAEALVDGMVIRGGRPFCAGTVDSHGDHRIAMAFVIASLRSQGEVRILDCAHVATSFPNFVRLASRAGLTLSTEGIQA